MNADQRKEAPHYAARVRELEQEGLCTSDAQSAADVEFARNAGARIADDCFCTGCGARGFRFLCPGCDK
jgi:hypothetical protein